MAVEKGRKQRCKRCRRGEGTGDAGAYSKRILLSRVIWCLFMELGKGVCVWWRLSVQSQSSSLPAQIPTVPLPLGCMSLCVPGCVRVCVHTWLGSGTCWKSGLQKGGFLGRTGVHSSFAHSCFLRSVLQFQGSARTQGCEQNMNDNLEKSHSSAFCLPGCTYALMSSGNQMLSFDLSISPERNISEANSLSEIFDSSTVLPHTILAHTKKPLENLGALITWLLLLP